jgi:CHASE3 domain sensor protein
MGLSNNLSLLKDIETGARGFALTGNRAYIEQML